MSDYETQQVIRGKRIGLPGDGYIPVLNNGFVKYLDHMGGDEDVIEAARTSTGRGFVSWEPYQRCEKCELTGSLSSVPVASLHASPCDHQWKAFPRGDNGLLEYLYVNRHMTPFEMCVGKFLVKAPIIFFRQLHRHRAASYNEMSGRYMQLPDDFYMPRPEDVKGKHATNKQGSGEKLEDWVVKTFLEDMSWGQQEAYSDYKQALDKGVAPELARMNLPVSINSVCVVQMNLRMLLHMLGLRDDGHAQGLTQEVAQAFAQFAKAIWPRTYALYEEHTKYAVTLSRSEAEEMKALLKGDKYMPREPGWKLGDAGMLSEKFLGKFK